MKENSKTYHSYQGQQPKFDLNQRVKTPSGITGTIIGMAEYRWGWDYRVHFLDENRYFKNRYYHETQLKEVE